MGEHDGKGSAVARRGAATVVGVVLAALAVLVAGAAPAGADDGFPDVPTSSPFHDDIAWAVDQDLTRGYPDGTFRPAAPVSRQAAVAFLHRWWTALGRPDPDVVDPGFTDVAPDHRFHTDIAWAVALGITTGYPDGGFHPTDPVSRQAMAAFLHRMALALDHDDPDPLADPGFADVAPDHRFHTDIAWAAALGITTGYPDGGFHPTDPVSRQAAAAFLHRQWDGLTIEVTEGHDAVDAAPGDGTCEATPGTGDCTLRAAIQEANAIPGHQRITVTPGLDAIHLTIEAIPDGALTPGYDDDDAAAVGDLDLTDHTTIDAPGVTLDASAVGARIQGCNIFQICVIAHADGTLDVPYGSGSPVVTLRGLRFAHGYAGGELQVDVGDVTVEEVTFEHNRGTIVSQSGGSVRLRRSSIVGNAGPVVLRSGSMVVEQTTIGAPAGDLLSVFCFRFFCTSTSPPDPSSWLRAEGGTLEVRSSTVEGLRPQAGADVTVTGSLLDVCDGTVTSGGYNAARPGCFLAPATGDIAASAGSLVAEPADNGGPTPTRLPWANAPGIDAIPPGTPGLCDGTHPTDQRGAPRPVGVACDVGAIEGHAPGPGPLTLRVDSPADAGDASPGDGACDDGTGACTLRAAIDEANATPGRDEVRIATGVQPVLALAGVGDDTNATGDLDVTDALTLDGRDVMTRVIRTTTLDAAGVDRALDAGADLAVRHLVITGGAAGDGEGGAIRTTDGDLRLQHATLTGNTARAGGALHVGPSSAATVERSTLSTNTAGAPGAPAHGGAVDAHGTELVVLDSTLGWNVATSGAEPAHGGAIHHAAGQLVVDGSTFHGNAARTTDSDALGGALATGGSGAPTAVTITRSTFHGNAAQGPNTADGGALHVDHASVSVAVTTISANQATRGPGVWLADRAAVRVDATILDHGGAPSCAGSVQPVAVPGDHNLAGDTACGFVGTGNRGGVASGLGPLGLDELVIVNGGSTPVRVPASDSPAVDAIAPGTVGLCDGTFPTDQRDRARPQGEGCDVGAVER